MMNDKSDKRSREAEVTAPNGLALLRQWAVFGSVAVVLGLLLVVVRHAPRRGDSPVPAGDTSLTATKDAKSPVKIPLIDEKDIDRAVVNAIKGARAKVEQSPKSSDTWGVLGLVFHAHEFNAEAATCYEQAEALDRRAAIWPYLQGRCFLMTDGERARPLLERAVALVGNNPSSPRLTLAELLLSLYQLDDAEKHIGAFLLENPNDPRARLAKARLTFLREDPAGCLQQLVDLRRSMEANPHFRKRTQSLLLLMSECLRRVGQNDESEKVRRVALQQSDPSWQDDYMKMVFDRQTGLKKQLKDADFMYGRREFDKSIQVLTTAVREYPDNIWAKILLARSLIHTGNPQSQQPHSDAAARLDAAVKLLDDVLKQDPHSVEAMFRLAVAKRYQNKLDEAEALYRRAIELKPDFTMAFYNLALCRREQGDIAGAVEAMQQAIRVQPDFIEGHMATGQWLLELRRNSEAERHLETASQLQPADERIRRMLGIARQRSQADQ